MKKYQDVFLYKITRPLVSMLFKLYYRPQIIGKENIASAGPVILAGNHTHNFDCLLLMASTKRAIHFLAKKELWHGLKKIIFANMGLIPVDRSKHDPTALDNAYGYLNNQKVIGIFPEGTTEKGRGLLPFKMGAVKMAKVTKTKITPFVITGHYRFLSRDLKIVFLEPFDADENLELSNHYLYNLIEKELEKDNVHI